MVLTGNGFYFGTLEKLLHSVDVEVGYTNAAD
jgi:hypothetical protein